jgi:hypothetical protein
VASTTIHFKNSTVKGNGVLDGDVDATSKTFWVPGVSGNQDALILRFDLDVSADFNFEAYVTQSNAVALSVSGTTTIGGQINIFENQAGAGDDRH